jgi:thioredoxin-like negative regulator of GroEL
VLGPDAPVIQQDTEVSSSLPVSPVSPVRILAFSSADCRQCHTLQRPALLRVAELREDIVSVVNIDAPSSPDLTERYQVLTVPTTVVLDATGKAHAVNYGFTNAQRLLEQVDAVLTKV